MGNRATPPGVNRSHGPSTRVGNEDRETIGRADRDQCAWLARNQRVSFAYYAIACGVRNQHSIGVNLFSGNHQTGWRPVLGQPGPETMLKPG
jgi:hypothetical protein